jgi:hypothetical protein
MKRMSVVASVALLGACASGGPRPPDSPDDVAGALEDLRELVLEQVMIQHSIQSSETFCLGLGGTYRNPIELPSDSLLARFVGSPFSVLSLDKCEVTDEGQVTAQDGRFAQAILINSIVLQPGNRVADAWVEAGLPTKGEYFCRASLGTEGWGLDGCVPMPSVVMRRREERQGSDFR